jgi:hydroxymethylbilane synthase
MADIKIRIGTRASKLAMAQTTTVASLLTHAHPGIAIEVVEIRTEGDANTSQPLEEIGGVGLFTKQIEQALIEQRVDLAVHSAKDLPSVMVDPLMLAAVPEREVIEDAWLARDNTPMAAIRDGMVVGTSSPRRRAQLLAKHPGAEVRDIRGNVQTRLAKLERGEYDALLMARAGLKRLDLDSIITEVLPPDRFLPACGQGALALQCRVDDEMTAKAVSALDHADSRRCLEVERHLLFKLQAGCSAAVGGWARLENNRLRLSAIVLDSYGKTSITTDMTAEQSMADLALAESVAQNLIAQGALALIEQAHE